MHPFTQGFSTLCFAATLLLMPPVAMAEELQWLEYSTGCDASLRGVSAVDDQVIWACGSKGCVVRSTDGGVHWKQCGPTGFSELEFRSIVAINRNCALIASAGTPAVILKTNDAGDSWKEVFRHDAPTAFFDAMKFWDSQHGIAFSDPVDGRLLIVTTDDGGDSWQLVAPEQIPAARTNEGGFAASNSVLCVAKAGRAWIGTGGATMNMARLYASADFGRTWTVSDCPMESDAAAGVFSIANHDSDKLMLAVGGDYRPNTPSKTTAIFSRDGGKNWKLAHRQPTEFVSAVIFVEARQTALAIATGPTGSYQSAEGDQWQQFSKVGFHALGSVMTGEVFAVGANGRFGKLLIDGR